MCQKNLIQSLLIKVNHYQKGMQLVTDYDLKKSIGSVINFPYSGITKIPGSELGFVRFYSDNILNRDEIFGEQEIMQIECGTIFSDNEKIYIRKNKEGGTNNFFWWRSCFDISNLE